MRAQDKKDRQYAQKLLEISKDGDRVCPQRVEAVIAHLQSNPPVRYRRVLKQFLLYVKRSIARSHALIECASSLDSASVSSIEQKLSAHYGRSISTETRSNPELIAGIRIHIADDVWDDTVSAHLESLKAK